MAFITPPAHIFFEIVYALFSRTPGDDDQIDLEQRTQTFCWLTTSLRLVNRSFYSACMHVLRTTYISSYQSHVRLPYTSDPLLITSTTPLYSAVPDTSASPLESIQQETAVLDRFIALKVHQDLFTHDSVLHTESEDAFRDLFSFAQPRARLEDLVRIYGVRDRLVVVGEGELIGSSGSDGGKVIPVLTYQDVDVTPSRPCAHISCISPLFSLFKFRAKLKSGSATPTLPPSSDAQFCSSFSFSLSSPPSSYSPPASRIPHTLVTPLPFDLLSVSFNPRTVALQLYDQRPGRIPRQKQKQIVAQVQRTRDETLEASARRLVRELRVFLESSSNDGREAMERILAAVPI